MKCQSTIFYRPNAIYWKEAKLLKILRKLSPVFSTTQYDLGAHLIDQALVLFGSPDESMADIAVQKEGGLSDDYFHLVLKFGSMRVILHGSSFSNSTPRYRILGTRANFTKYGLDPQEEQLRQGNSPGDPTFGIECEDKSGQLFWPEEGRGENLISERGNYLRFYEQLYAFVANGEGEVPVTAADALSVIEIIELAQESSRTGRR